MATPGEAVVVRLPERFEAFYEREYHRVVGFAYAVAGSCEAAEDATQEAFLRALDAPLVHNASQHLRCPHDCGGKGAAEGWVVERRKATRSTFAGKSLARRAHRRFVLIRLMLVVLTPADGFRCSG